MAVHGTLGQTWLNAFLSPTMSMGSGGGKKECVREEKFICGNEGAEM